MDQCTVFKFFADEQGLTAAFIHSNSKAVLPDVLKRCWTTNSEAHVPFLSSPQRYSAKKQIAEFIV